MPGVPRQLAEHTLNVDPTYKPVKQFLRRFNEERRKAIGEEVARLLAAGFIVEVFHPEWLANPVLVLKKNGTWRMCVDYTDLNKACPADPFAIGEEVARLLAAGFIVEVFHPEWLANPVLVLKKNGTWRMCVDYTDLNKACPADPFALPRIDQIIDATAGCERLSFLDEYSGYHQIKMAVKDQEKTTFITPFGAFCYVSMPFGLKSAQATYQRCVQNCLHKQIGRNVHAYVDDIVVKSREKETLIDDLRETFDNLRTYKMTFITPFGAFCYVSMPFGLKSAQATYQRCVQNCLHKQIGRNVHAYVDDIVVKSREKETLIDDLRETFDNLRTYKMMLNPDKCVFGVPANPPVLAAPVDKEPLLLYVAANVRAVSVAIGFSSVQQGN